MANSILEQLNANGVSVGKLAKELGVSRSSIYQSINGEGSSRKIRLWIAENLGKRPSHLWPERSDESLLVDDTLWILNILKGLIQP